MKILYLSSHSVLEYQELSILTELDRKTDANLNIEVFSMGAYLNPTQSGDFLRGVIPHGVFYPKLHQIAMQCDKDNIHPELLEWADVVLSMHNAAVPGQIYMQPWIGKNWELFKKMDKKVVWRSIGQSTPQIEEELQRYRSQGLKIIRYSPLEKYMPGFAGEDAMIRFSEDENEYCGWNGDKEMVIAVAQSMKRRGEHLGFNIFDQVTDGLNRKVYGTENDDLGEINGGTRTHGELKRDLRDARCLFYYGTQPAPYTMVLVEAMMTGVPIVAVGEKLRNTGMYPWQKYEVPSMINNGVNGFVSDDIHQLREYVEFLLHNKEKALEIGEAGRKTAIELFGRQKRLYEWADFLKTLL